MGTTGSQWGRVLTDSSTSFRTFGVQFFAIIVESAVYSIPKPSEKSALGLGQSPYNRRSQIGSYCINTDQFAKPAVVDSRELSLKPKNRFFRFFGYRASCKTPFAPKFAFLTIEFKLFTNRLLLNEYVDLQTI